MRAILLLIALFAGADARAGTALCRADLGTGTFDWSIDGTPVGQVVVERAAELLATLEARLDAGDPADSLRARLGALLLGPVHASLATCPAWRLVPLDTAGMPGNWGTLPTLILPGSDGVAVLQRHAVSFAWPEPLIEPAPFARSGDGSLLLSAPFRPGRARGTDDPDTLRRALRGVVHNLRMVPRNEADATSLRRALEEDAPSVWWFRAGPGQLSGLQPAFGALPDVVIWSLPADVADGPALTPQSLGSGGAAPAAQLLPRGPARERAVALLGRDLVDGLARGLTVGSALHLAQRRVLGRGDGILVAASLVLVGDPDTTCGLRRAGWLQRWLRGGG